MTGSGRDVDSRSRRASTIVRRWEQIGERRDTTLAAFIARGERAIGFVELPIRPSFRNEGAAAIWKRNEQEVNAAPSQSPHDFEIASLQRMELTQNLHRTREVAEMGSL